MKRPYMVPVTVMLAALSPLEAPTAAQATGASGSAPTVIVDTVGGWVNSAKFIFFFAVFLVCALTTSQSTATRTIVPIGLASGLAPALITGMWAGAFAGIYTLPTNGSQIAAANFDETGSTKLGTKLIDHSFFIPMAVLSVSTDVVGSLLAIVFY